jgi:hypothetical protein
MTQMSELLLNADSTNRVNRSDLQAGSRLAHRVHGSLCLVRLVACSMLFGACVIPPSLSVDNQDAGQNSPPAITRVSADGGGLRDGESALFTQGEGTLSVDLVDTDINDTLQIRIFVDYTIDNPTAPRVTHTVAPSGQPTRNVSFGIAPLCTSAEVDDTTHQHTMSVIVFDRLPVETDEKPVFQKMPDNSGGLSTSHFYILKCSAKSS